MANIYDSVNCNICGSNNEESVTKDDNYDCSMKVVLCKECGLGYINPRWTLDEYNRFYENNYDDEYRKEIKSNKAEETVESIPLIKRMEEHKLFPSKVENILDIGCGAGDNLMSLQNRFAGSSAFAIEPSLNAHKILKQRGIELVSTDVNDNWIEKNKDKFDIIIMRHVLEHMLNPKEVLAHISSTLKGSGVLYIAVPNNLNPVHHMRKKWFRIVHTYYFNRFTLRNLVERAGYEVLFIADEDGLVAGEVYVILRKSDNVVVSEISSENYIKQRDVFAEKEKEDSKVFNIIRNNLQKIYVKLLKK